MEIPKPETVKKTKPKEKESKEKKADETKAGVPKIRSYDYAAWDKFDVEAACEEVEKEAGTESDSAEEEVAPFNTAPAIISFNPDLTSTPNLT